MLLGVLPLYTFDRSKRAYTIHQKYIKRACVQGEILSCLYYLEICVVSPLICCKGKDTKKMKKRRTAHGGRLILQILKRQAQRLAASFTIWKSG